MKKIDIHTHLIENICGVGSEGELRNLGKGMVQYATGRTFRLIPEVYGEKITPELLLSVLHQHNVVHTVCLQGNYAGFQNLYTYEAMIKYPNEITGAATYDPFSYQKDLIIENLFDCLKFKVIKMEVSNGSGLMANHDTIDLNGPKMHEVYQMALKHHLIFYIDIGRPNNNCYQVEALSKAIKQYPNMTFIICHLTAPQHHQKDILENNMRLLKAPNIYFDLAALPNNTKEAYPYPEAISYIRQAIDIVGKDKIMWGSDFPAAMNHTTYEQSYAYIENSEVLSQDEKEAILYANAKKVFHL